jgi:hypothetical protein
LGLLEDVERFSQPLPPRVELVGSESSFIYVYCIVFNREIIEEYHFVCYAYFPDFLFGIRAGSSSLTPSQEGQDHPLPNRVARRYIVAQRVQEVCGFRDTRRVQPESAKNRSTEFAIA